MNPALIPLNRPIAIANAVSGRLLDADQDTIQTDGTKVQLYGRSAKSLPNRQWSFASAGDDKYYIVNVMSGRFLDADLGTLNAVPAGKIQLYGTALPTGEHRKWRIGWTSTGHLAITNVANGRVLGANPATLNADGGEVALWSPPSELWPHYEWCILPGPDLDSGSLTPHPFRDAPATFSLLIVTPFRFRTLFEQFRAAKRRCQNIESHIISLCDTAEGLGGVVNEFPGADHPERIKRAIAYARWAHGAEYVLLAGDGALIPARYQYVKTEPGETGWPGALEGAYNGSDLYYADLFRGPGSPAIDLWDANGDGRYNEQEFHRSPKEYNPDDVVGYPEVAIGRIPARTAAELTTYLDKAVSYLQSVGGAIKSCEFTYLADWDLAEDTSCGGPAYCRDAAKALPAQIVSGVAYPGPQKTVNGAMYIFNLPAGQQPPTGFCVGTAAELCKAASTSYWISYFGHGVPQGWVIDGGYAWHIAGMSTGGNTPIVFAAACNTGQFMPNTRDNPYQDVMGNYHSFTYQWKDDDIVAIEERDAAGSARSVPKRLVPPPPSPYDREVGETQGRTVASAWLFHPHGGAIAYFGEMVTKEDDYACDLEKALLKALGSGHKTLGKALLAAQRQYWEDNQESDGNFRAPRIYLGIMTFFGDPSLPLPGSIIPSLAAPDGVAGDSSSGQPPPHLPSFGEPSAPPNLVLNGDFRRWIGPMQDRIWGATTVDSYYISARCGDGQADATRTSGSPLCAKLSECPGWGATVRFPVSVQGTLEGVAGQSLTACFKARVASGEAFVNILEATDRSFGRGVALSTITAQPTEDGFSLFTFTRPIDQAMAAGGCVVQLSFPAPCTLYLSELSCVLGNSPPQRFAPALTSADGSVEIVEGGLRLSGSAPPAAGGDPLFGGDWQAGDTIQSSSAGDGSPGWVCVAAGRPGTWQPL